MASTDRVAKALISSFRCLFFGAVDLHAGAVSTSLRTLLARIEILRRFLEETKKGKNARVMYSSGVLSLTFPCCTTEGQTACSGRSRCRCTFRMYVCRQTTMSPPNFSSYSAAVSRRSRGTHPLVDGQITALRTVVSCCAVLAKLTRSRR